MAKGIDYGLGHANIDNATGIRYGIISPHSLSGDALEAIYSHGDNMTHAAAVEDAKARITDALRPILDDMGVLPYVSKYAPRSEDANKQTAYMAEVAEGVWDSIEQEWNDQYEEQEDSYRYTEDGYVVETSSLGIFVIKSPFYTFAAFCSPCAPGAGDLDSPQDDGVKTYCFGVDWFDADRPLPYAVYRVDDDTRVEVAK